MDFRSMSITKWLNAASVLLALGATGSHAELLAQTYDAGADCGSHGIVKAARTADMPVHVRQVNGCTRATQTRLPVQTVESLNRRRDCVLTRNEWLQVPRGTSACL